MRVVNFYTANSLEVGDVLLATVKLIVTPFGYRLYRCDINAPREDGIPQGDRLSRNEKEVASAIFSLAVALGLKPDAF